MQETIAPEAIPPKGRPYLLSLICIFTFTWYFIYTLFFAAGFLFSSWVSKAMEVYSPEKGFNPNMVKASLGILSLLFIGALTGTFLMWRMSRKGYYLFGISSLGIASVQFGFPSFSFAGILVPVILIFLYGLFFRRFR